MHDSSHSRAPRAHPSAPRNTRGTAFTGALLLALLTPAAARAQDACKGTLNRATFASQVVASGLATAFEYDGMRSQARWSFANESNPTKVLLDPSSHLHALGSYHMARSAYTTTCADQRERVRAAWKSAALSLSVGLSKEVADGFYNGFSKTDLAVDAMGAGFAVAQAHWPVLEKVTPTFSKSWRALDQASGARATVLNYAQQTAWLSANVHDLLPTPAARYWPAPVRLSVGRRAFGAGVQSEYVLGLDLDAEALPGNHPLWVRTKRALHYLRLPGPAVVMTASGTKTVGLYW